MAYHHSVYTFQIGLDVVFSSLEPFSRGPNTHKPQTYKNLRKLRPQILVGDRRSWDLFLDIKFWFFENFFIFACDRVLLHPTETLF